MDLGDILIVEGLAVLVLFVWYLIQANRAVRNGGVILQRDVQTTGRVLTFIAFVSNVGFSRYLRGDSVIGSNDRPWSIFVVVSTLDVILSYTGLRFALAAYQPREKMDPFVKTIYDCFRSFWRDGTE
jgi:hypothetical protein